MLRLCVWSILLIAAASAQHQDEQIVCPIRGQNLKDTLEKHHKQCMAVVDKKLDRFRQIVAQELRLLSNNAQEGIVQLTNKQDRANSESSEDLDEIKEFVTQALNTTTTILGAEIKSLILQVEGRIVKKVATENKHVREKLAALEQIVVLGKCKIWKDKVSGLALRKLETGAYHFSETMANWTNAVEICKARGMDLVSIESEKEMILLDSNRGGNVFWVWASDIGQTPGDFYWQDGPQVDQKWRENLNHYGAGKETCLYLGSDGRLKDFSCTSLAYYICVVSAEYFECV